LLDLDDSDVSELVADLDAAERESAIRTFGRVLLFALVVTSPLALWLQRRNRMSRTVIALYDVDDMHPRAQHFQQLIDAFRQVQGALGAWTEAASGALTTTTQRKVHGGAGTLVDRRLLARHLRGPRHLKSNLDVPTMEAPGRAVYFPPDQVLVQEGSRFASYSYMEINTVFNPTNWIEDGPFPRDAQQVGTTWRYVNVKGGPDRRFKDNSQLPVMRYGEVIFRTSTEIQCVWMISSLIAAQNLEWAITQMRSEALGPVPPE
jgi:DNA polymerase-3 subunit epsilon